MVVIHGPGYMVSMLIPIAALAGWILSSFFPRKRQHLSRNVWPILSVLLIVTLLLVDSYRTHAKRLRHNRSQSIIQNDLAERILSLAGHDTNAILVVGGPVLRSIVGGEPIEHDVHWIHGRENLIEATWSGGLEAYATHLVSMNPSIIYIGKKAEAIRPDMLGAMSDNYSIHNEIQWDGQPVYVRSDDR